MTPTEIGKKVRELRGKQSLRDFAKKCGVSHTSIDTIEKGYDFRTNKPVKIKLVTLQKIADACKIPLAFLLEEKISKKDELKIAIFGDAAATDEMLDKVLEYAKFIKWQNKLVPSELYSNE